MRRFLLTFVTLSAAALFASDASACHKKACTPACAPVAVCAPAPVVECAPVVAECAPVKKCCFKMPKFKMPKFGGLCHKKAACAAPVACEPCAAPAVYEAPMASPQASPQMIAPSAQASMQG